MHEGAVRSRKSFSPFITLRSILCLRPSGLWDRSSRTAQIHYDNRTSFHDILIPERQFIKQGIHSEQEGAKIAGKKLISDEVIESVTGGTEEEIREMSAYIYRKFPALESMPKDEAIVTILFASMPLYCAEMSNDYDPTFKNRFTMDDGRVYNHAEMMAMLKEKFGE